MFFTFAVRGERVGAEGPGREASGEELRRNNLYSSELPGGTLNLRARLAAGLGGEGQERWSFLASCWLHNSSELKKGFSLAFLHCGCRMWPL